MNYKKAIYYISLFLTIVYLDYRIFYTLPSTIGPSLLFAIIVLLIELIDGIFFAVYTLNVLVEDSDIPEKPKLSKKDYPEIDVLIATINEDIDLVEGTINACKSMKYPNKDKVHIYLCDDGNRKEMKALCQKHKINYITRTNNKDAKAGNYNNALKKTKSPYIVVFDADMQPTNDFLIKTVPYLFKEEKVGFVQLPQSFNNPDIFQSRYKLSRYIPFEQDYFYHRIQMARNNNNSVVFCGTNTILSRKALEEIGGFATETLTEDFATGLLIESKGYKGIALPYDEAYGSNVENITTLIKQRIRWCRGCIQTFKNYKIIGNEGLTFKQKLDYLSGIYYWLYGFRNIIYLLVPLLYSFFDIRIIQGNLLLFVILFFLQYILKRFIIDKLEDRKVSSTWNRIYEVVLSPVILIASLLEILGFTKKKFEVTIKKKKSKESFRYGFLIISHFLLFILNVLGLYASVRKGLENGFIEFLIPIFWLTTNSIYLIFALIFDLSNSNNNEVVLEKETRKKQYAFSSPLVLTYKFVVKEIRVKRIILVLTMLLVIGLGFLLNSYYQYRKTIIIKKDALVSYNGNLSIQDGNIVNEKGKIVRLNGVSTHNLTWFGRIYTKENLKEIRDTWGINTIRIAVYTNPEEKGYIDNKEQINDIKRIMDYCIELNLYVIVDWHILKDNNPNIYKEEAIEFFKEISKDYSNVPNVIYEICNEPNGKDVTWDKDIKPYSEQLIKVIRANSEKSLIIVGLANWCKDIESARKNLLEDKNTLYAVHFYAGDSKSNNLKGEIDLAKNIKMPLIVTECGPTKETGDGNLYKDEFEEWIQFLEERKISWIVWQFSEKDESSSLLIEKEIQDRLDFLYEKYTEEELEKKKYHINDYLSETGIYMQKIFQFYN